MYDFNVPASKKVISFERSAYLLSCLKIYKLAWIFWLKKNGVNIVESLIAVLRQTLLCDINRTMYLKMKIQ